MSRSCCDLLSRLSVCRILGVTEAALRQLIETGLLASPTCRDQLRWRRAELLRFIWRRCNDPDFDYAVRAVIDGVPAGVLTELERQQDDDIR